jgi:hypothetical protein
MDYSRQAKRRWPRASWLEGTGRYASVSRCQGVITAKLFGTLAEAEEAKAEGRVKEEAPHGGERGFLGFRGGTG